MTIANDIIGLALKTAGVVGVGQTPLAQDVADSLTVLNNMIVNWNNERSLIVYPQALPQFADLTTDVPFWSSRESALRWGLSVRLRPLYGLPEDKQQTELATNAVTILQSTNRQQMLAQAAATTDATGNGLILLALRAAGRVTDDQNVALGSQDMTDGLLLLQEMIGEWQLARTVAVTPGVLPIITDPTVGVGLPTGYANAIVLNLAMRIREMFGLGEQDTEQAKKARQDRASDALSLVMASNKQQQPAPTIAQNDGTWYGLVYLALRAAGRVSDSQGVAVGSQDVSDAMLTVSEMLAEWQQDRTVTVTPGTFPVVGSGASATGLAPTYVSAVVLNLAVRLRDSFGLPENKNQAAQAARAFARIQANNKQQIAPLHPGVPATALQIVFMALRMAGRITDAQSVSDASQDVDDAFSQLVMMLAQWSQKRWLVYDLSDVFVTATGAASYTIGMGGAFNVPRPDTIEAAFARLGVGTALAVDYPLTVLNAREDYDRIAVKGLTSFPSTMFYDAAYPLGNVYVWPVPGPQFELHLSIKATLPTYASSAATLGLPPEYNEAMIANLALRIMAMVGQQPSAWLLTYARDTLQTIRSANIQVPLAQMPAGLMGRGGWGGGGFGIGGFAQGGLSPVPGGGAAVADLDSSDLGSDFAV